MFLKLFFFISYFCLSQPQSTGVTFNNVTFTGYRNKYVKTCKILMISSKRLEDYLPQMTLQRIEIIDQEIPVLYEYSLTNLNGLEYLFIENSKVSEIRPGVMWNVPTLRKFSLKGNTIYEIKEGIFSNLQIWQIDLSKNAITTIESGAFDDMPVLLYLNLNNNKISVWNHEWFKNTPQLVQILMQNNSLNELVEGAFNNFRGTKTIYGNTASLYLDFSWNNINKINPKAFQGLYKIGYLRLNNNKLKTIANDFLQGIYKINYLNLFNNLIVHIEGNFDQIFKAESTNLKNNPLNCDCWKKISAWTQTNNHTVYLPDTTLSCRIQKLKKLKDKMKILKQRIEEYDDLFEGEDVEKKINVSA